LSVTPLKKRDAGLFVSLLYSQKKNPIARNTDLFLGFTQTAFLSIKWSKLKFSFEEFWLG
jgi:hypothetical protein